MGYVSLGFGGAQPPPYVPKTPEQVREDKHKFCPQCTQPRGTQCTCYEDCGHEDCYYAEQVMPPVPQFRADQ